jgi:hypothetical protein
MIPRETVSARHIRSPFNTTSPSCQAAVATLVRRLILLLAPALVLLAVPLGAQPANDRVLGPNTWTDSVGRFRGESRQMREDSAFRKAAAREGPFARLNRIAQDYAYAIHERPNDEKLVRRLLSENLKPVESFTGKDGTGAAVFQDLKTGRYIITFRGTQVTNDNYRNAVESTKGGQTVGTLSYAEHHAIFDRWAEQYGKDGGLTVTGHSRGGAMAQIFTSFHGDKIALTGTFQSPGADQTVHRRYEKIPFEKRGQNILFVATNDAVADVGGDHLGKPAVFLFNGKDVDGTGKKSADRIFGHSSFGSQPAGLLDSAGNPYRDGQDARRLVKMDYTDYKTEIRGGALIEMLKDASKALNWMLGGEATTSMDTGGTAAKVDAKTIAAFMRREGSDPQNTDWKKKVRDIPDPSTMPLPARTKPTASAQASTIQVATTAASAVASVAVDPAPPPKPAASADPAASYQPGAGRYAGTILIRQKNKTYKGLTLDIAADKVTGRMLADKDQDTVLDWRFSGGWKTFRIQGNPTSQRKLSGEIQGTVMGVHIVTGSFLINTAGSNDLTGSWSVNFQSTGEKWSGPFEVHR